MNKGILISSEKLKKNYPKKKILNEYVNANLYKINSLIDDGYKNNQSEIFVNLPISFNISNTINHTEFQTEVYYSIISILESKGYKVHIRINKNETIIKINWSFENENDIGDMKKKIKSIIF